MTAVYLDVGEVLNLRMLRIYDQDMLNGTAKVSVMEYDEGGFVINDVVCCMMLDLVVIRLCLLLN